MALDREMDGLQESRDILLDERGESKVRLSTSGKWKIRA